MSVAVLGPGAVGGMLAVHLVRAGRSVTCVARAETAAAIAVDGITVVHDGAELHARPATAERLAAPVDVLLVTVKGQGLAAALEQIDAEPALVVPLLNGMEHVDALRHRFAHVVAATIGRVEAYREGPARIVQLGTPLVTVAGEVAPAELQAPGLEIRAGSGEKDVLWSKLARQAPLALLTATTGLPVGDVRSDPRLRTMVEEACAVAAADGAATSFAQQWAMIESLPADLITSTARDVAAGRPSELDAIAGAVVRAGRRLDVATPMLEELLVLCPA